MGYIYTHFVQTYNISCECTKRTKYPYFVQTYKLNKILNDRKLMKFNHFELQHIKDSAEAIFRYYGTDLKKMGDYAVGLCPFHHEKKPSFNVRISGPKRGQWCCYSCGVVGNDIFSFVAKMENMDCRRDFPKVVKKAAEILNFPIGATCANYEKRTFRTNVQKEPPVFVEQNIVDCRMTTRERTKLFRFVCRYFPTDEVRQVFADYRTGGFFYDWSAFPYINAEGNCIDIHYQAYDNDGHRQKAGGQTWELFRQKQKDRRGPWCMFGEHLINARPDAPIGIVESEKTALVASLFMPEYVWLATCGLARLKAETCAAVRERNCYLFPDADGVQAWTKQAEKMKAEGFENLIIAADFVLRYAEQPKDDLADIILRQIENER